MNKPKIEDFLQLGGAEILPTTNPWEVVRFQTQFGKHVVYRNAKGNTSYSDEYAKTAYRAWHNGKKWMAGVKVSRNNVKQMKVALLSRDGDCCFFCQKPMGDDVTIEHLMPISCGGTNHFANLALAHKQCNIEAGDMCVVEKVKLRERMIKRDEF